MLLQKKSHRTTQEKRGRWARNLRDSKWEGKSSSVASEKHNNIRRRQQLKTTAKIQVGDGVCTSLQQHNHARLLRWDASPRFGAGEFIDFLLHAKRFYHEHKEKHTGEATRESWIIQNKFWFKYDMNIWYEMFSSKIHYQALLYGNAAERGTI